MYNFRESLNLAHKMNMSETLQISVNSCTSLRSKIDTTRPGPTKFRCEIQYANL